MAGSRARQRRCSAGWGRDTSGSTAVEFAMVLGPLLVLTIGIFDIGFVSLKQSALQNGVAHVQRLVRTGGVTSRDAALKELCRHRAVMAGGDCGSMGLDIRQYEGYAVPTLTELRSSQAFAFDVGGRGSLVLIRAYDVHRPAMPAPTSLLDGSADILVEAASLVWVEP